MVDDQGFVTEGTSSSSWIDTPEKVVVTRALTNDILPGGTRDTVPIGSVGRSRHVCRVLTDTLETDQ